MGTSAGSRREVLLLFPRHYTDGKDGLGTRLKQLSNSRKGVEGWGGGGGGGGGGVSHFTADREQQLVDQQHEPVDQQQAWGGGGGGGGGRRSRGGYLH